MRKSCDLCNAKLFGEDARVAGRCPECHDLARLEASLEVKDAMGTTPHRPGSPSKVAVLARRVKLHLPLHSPGESVDDIPD